jgi:E2/UBC family protein E
MVSETTRTRKKVVIFINDARYEAPEAVLTGLEIKQLGNIPPENRLFKEVPGPRDDIAIGDTDVVELRHGDRFYDLPRGVHGGPSLVEALRPDLERIQSDIGPIIASPQVDGTLHVVIGPIRLPTGWSRPDGRILIVVPPGYPEQRPTGFFTETGLLAHGAQPRGSGLNQVGGEAWTYFCWNPATWNVATDGLWKYIKVMAERFEEVA